MRVGHETTHAYLLEIIMSLSNLPRLSQAPQRSQNSDFQTHFSALKIIGIFLEKNVNNIRRGELSRTFINEIF